MNAFLRSGFVLMVFFSPVAGQEQYRTKGGVNGRAWAELDSAAKISFVAGFYEALEPLSAVCQQDIKSFPVPETRPGIEVACKIHKVFSAENFIPHPSRGYCKGS